MSDDMSAIPEERLGSTGPVVAALSTLHSHRQADYRIVPCSNSGDYKKLVTKEGK